MAMNTEICESCGKRVFWDDVHGLWLHGDYDEGGYYCAESIFEIHEGLEQGS